MHILFCFFFSNILKRFSFLSLSLKISLKIIFNERKRHSIRFNLSNLRFEYTVAKLRQQNSDLHRKRLNIQEPEDTKICIDIHPKKNSAPSSEREIHKYCIIISRTEIRMSSLSSSFLRSLNFTCNENRSADRQKKFLAG